MCDVFQQNIAIISCVKHLEKKPYIQRRQKRTVFGILNWHESFNIQNTNNIQLNDVMRTFSQSLCRCGCVTIPYECPFTKQRNLNRGVSKYYRLKPINKAHIRKIRCVTKSPKDQQSFVCLICWFQPILLSDTSVEMCLFCEMTFV